MSATTAEILQSTVAALKGVVQAECPVCGGGWFSTREGERLGSIHHVECPRNGEDSNQDTERGDA